MGPVGGASVWPGAPSGLRVDCEPFPELVDLLQKGQLGSGISSDHLRVGDAAVGAARLFFLFEMRLSAIDRVSRRLR